MRLTEVELAEADLDNGGVIEEYNAYRLLRLAKEQAEEITKLRKIKTHLEEVVRDLKCVESPGKIIKDVIYYSERALR